MALSNHRDPVAEWRRLLPDSSVSKRCAQNSEGLSACQFWDTSFHTASDPELDRLRKIDKANYIVWVDCFVTKAGGHVRSALAALERGGCCMPCLGRAMFAYLRAEYLAQYRYPERQLGTRKRLCNATPPVFVKATGREATRLRQVIRAGQCSALFASVLVVSGKPHYKEMALLLNHGRDAALPFENGVMGPMDFRVIEAFTPRMLRYRANVGSSDAAFAKLFDAHEDKHALLEYQGKKFLGQANQ
jgi:hypothetical protein